MDKKELQTRAADYQKKLDVVNAKLSAIAKKEKKEQEKKQFSYKQLDSFEKCCKVTGDDPKDPKFKNKDTYEMCKVIVKAINGGQELGSTIYFPYFDRTKKPGSGFFYGSIDFWTDSYVGISSRLAYVDSDCAIFGGRMFEKIYYKHIMLKP